MDRHDAGPALIPGPLHEDLKGIRPGDHPADDGGTLQLQVTHCEPLTPRIRAYTLRSPDGHPLPAFAAGAHIDVHLPDGSGRVRPYSLCHDDRDRSRYQIAIQREDHGRGGSRTLHALLQPGVLLRVGRPRNAFALRAAPHVQLLAGGIGLTPLLAMADALWAEQRSFALQVAVRSADQLAFASRLAQAPWAARLQVQVDDGSALPPGLRASGTGALDLNALLRACPPGTLAYACGPAGFMAAVQAAARALGWDAARVVVEHFGAPPAQAADATADATADASDPAQRAFELLWQPTGQRVAVAGGQSAAQALQAAGLPVALSCEQGVCGSCTLQLLDGQADHRDSYHTDAEHAAQTLFTPCCSRAHSARLAVAPLGWRPPPV